MPTRCGHCLSDRLEYLPDGSARCAACGALTSPSYRARTDNASVPQEASASSSPSTPAVASPPRLEGTTGWPVLIGEPSLAWHVPDPKRREQLEGRIKIFALASIFLSLAFLFAGIPLILSYAPEPIIHMSNFYITGGTNCVLVQHMTLTNSGGRAGSAVVTFYVDHVPYTNWSYVLDARVAATEDPSVFVANCQSHAYGIGLASVEPV